jgi:hypothetical protein
LAVEKSVIAEDKSGNVSVSCEVKGLVDYEKETNTFRYMLADGKTFEIHYKLKGVPDLRSFRKKHEVADRRMWKARKWCKIGEPFLRVGSEIAQIIGLFLQAK